MKPELRMIKITSRLALGLVWLYEGLFPKLLFLRADEVDLVKKCHLTWRTPESTFARRGFAWE